MAPSDSYRLIAILTLAGVIRLGAAVGLQWRLDHGSREVCLIPGDAEGYWILAGTIAAGEDYEIYAPPRRVMRMPGFPAVLALSRAVFPDRLLAARIWLALIGTAGCGFVFLLGRELCDASVGLWAAAVVAFSPVLAMFSVMLLSETAFATALTASLFVLVRLHHRLREPKSTREVWLALGSGALIALATYMRPTWLLIAPIAAVLILFGNGFSSIGFRSAKALFRGAKADFSRRLRAAALICVAAYGALLPWGLRNLAVTGHFTLTTFWMGPSLYDGLNPEATGDSDMTFFDRENLLAKLSEYEMDQTYRRRAREFAWAHPARTLELMRIKLERYWSPLPNAAQFQRPWIRAFVAASFLAILVPALYGTWLARRRFELLLVAWGPILYFAAIHMLFVGSIRYRLPAEYPFAVLSGVGLAAWHCGCPLRRGRM
jgi:4-amino-4-deoxy-L-arabinose transferase-like glycosyltransferase